MAKSKSDYTVVFRATAEDVGKLDELCADDDRSRGSMLRHLIAEAHKELKRREKEYAA